MFRRAWVQLSPIHERLARRLLLAHEEVVSERELSEGGGRGERRAPTRSASTFTASRRYLAPLGLEIRGVRGEGWVLQQVRRAAVGGADLRFPTGRR